jgi:hypothetical protein
MTEAGNTMFEQENNARILPLSEIVHAMSTVLAVPSGMERGCA